MNGQQVPNPLALIALRAALVAAHPVALYAAWLGAKAEISRTADPAQRRVWEAIASALDSAYAEKEQAA